MDTKALNEVPFSHTFAKYKIIDRLALHKKIIETMKKFPFSINVDECTATSGMKVFTITVSYFDETASESIVDHYCSFECIRTIATKLFDKLCQTFIKVGIPFENLISDLSDSAAYMRDEKNGIEKRCASNYRFD